MEDRPRASVLANPTVWFAVQVVEFLVVLWVVRHTVPSSWPVGAWVAIFPVLVIALTWVNLGLRRRFLAGWPRPI